MKRCDIMQQWVYLLYRPASGAGLSIDMWGSSPPHTSSPIIPLALRRVRAHSFLFINGSPLTSISQQPQRRPMCFFKANVLDCTEQNILPLLKYRSLNFCCLHFEKLLAVVRGTLEIRSTVCCNNINCLPHQETVNRNAYLAWLTSAINRPISS